MEDIPKKPCNRSILDSFKQTYDESKLLRDNDEKKSNSIKQLSPSDKDKNENIDNSKGNEINKEINREQEEIATTDSSNSEVCANKYNHYVITPESPPETHEAKDPDIDQVKQEEKVLSPVNKKNYQERALSSSKKQLTPLTEDKEEEHIDLSEGDINLLMNFDEYSKKIIDDININIKSKKSFHIRNRSNEFNPSRFSTKRKQSNISKSSEDPTNNHYSSLLVNDDLNFKSDKIVDNIVDFIVNDNDIQEKNVFTKMDESSFIKVKENNKDENDKELGGSKNLVGVNSNRSESSTNIEKGTDSKNNTDNKDKLTNSEHVIHYVMPNNHIFFEFAKEPK